MSITINPNRRTIDGLREAADLFQALIARQEYGAGSRETLTSFAERFDGGVVERADDERVRISRALSRTVEVQMTAPITDVGGVRQVMRYRPILADLTPTKRQAA